MTTTDTDASPTEGEAIEDTEPAETPGPSVPQQMFDLPAGNRHNIADSVSAPVITALPGDGWRVRCTLRDGQEWTERVVAWTVHSNGHLVPVCVDEEGDSYFPTSDTKIVTEVFHPDGRKAAAKPA